MMMTDAKIRICMFGNLTLTTGEKQISSSDNRSRKSWTLLAYLLCHRERVVPSEELTRVIWSEDNTNPTAALKTGMFRLRSLLDELEDGLGHTLILNKSGGYRINPELPIWVDIDSFETLCREAKYQGEEVHTEPLLTAVALYTKEFCTMQSTEAWVIPLAAYYRNLYIQLLETLIPLLEKEGRQGTGMEICRSGIAIEPYQESFYQLYMRCLLVLNRREEVISAYEKLSSLLLSTFGVMPDRESRTLYREALQSVETRVVSPETVEEWLVEDEPVKGALLCDFDFFRNVYQATARMLARNGDAVHIVLLTIRGKDEKALARRSLDVVMENMEKLICSSLRKGDVVSKCSSSQFVIMLPQANFENSQMVCERIRKKFYQNYPRTPAVIQCMVKPMIPTTTT